MADRRERRFSINLPLPKEIRLILWGHTRGVTKTRMAEAILIDRVSNDDNWREVCLDLKQEAAINQCHVNDLVKQVLVDNGMKDVFDVDAVNWEDFLTNETVVTEETE